MVHVLRTRGDVVDPRFLKQLFRQRDPRVRPHGIADAQAIAELPVSDTVVISFPRHEERFHALFLSLLMVLKERIVKKSTITRMMAENGNIVKRSLQLCADHF